MIAIVLFASACAQSLNVDEELVTLHEDAASEDARTAIEDAMPEDIRAQLELLRETVKELHGPEAVEEILAEREKALKASAEEMAAQNAAMAIAEEIAVKAAVKEVNDAPPVVLTDSGKAGD